MIRKKRTEITIETDEFFTVHRNARVILAWCVDCGDVTRLVTVDQAALATGVSSRAIYGRVEEGCIHYRETAEGLLLICLNSLLIKRSLEDSASALWEAFTEAHNGSKDCS